MSEASNAPGSDPATEATPAAGGGEPAKQQPAFKVIRSQPQPTGGTRITFPLLLVLTLIGAAGWYVFKSGSSDPVTDGTPTPAPSAAPEVEVPEWVTARLDFLEGEGLIETALEEAEQHLETFPNRDLRTRIERYKRSLGELDDPRPISELLAEARAALKESGFESARDAADEILAQDGEHAEAYYIRGVCRGLLDDKLGAASDLQSAIDFGFNEAEAKRWIKRFE